MQCGLTSEIPRFHIHVFQSSILFSNIQARINQHPFSLDDSRIAANAVLAWQHCLIDVIRCCYWFLLLTAGWHFQVQVKITKQHFKIFSFKHGYFRAVNSIFNAHTHKKNIELKEKFSVYVYVCVFMLYLIIDSRQHSTFLSAHGL